MASRMFVVLIALAWLAQAPVFAAESCDPTWQESDRNLTMGLRSNARHFWSWIGQKANSKYFPAELLRFTGVIVGDAHHENFSHIFKDLNSDTRVYVLNDFDDTGTGPFYLEYLKFLIVSRSVLGKEKHLAGADMFDAYVAGLKGKKPNGMPDYLKRDSKLDQSDLARDYKEKLDPKIDDSDGTLKKDKDIIRWKDMTGKQKEALLELERKYFRHALPKGYKITDRAIVVVNEGGSRGMSRYWYALTHENDKRAWHVIEFKELGAGALACYDKNSQPRLEKRLAAAKQYYMAGTNNPLFRAVEAGDQVFWMRPKYPKYVDIQISKAEDKEKAEFAELSLYIAQMLGYWHSQQLATKTKAEFVEYLEKNRGDVLEKTQVVQNLYLKAAGRIHNDE